MGITHFTGLGTSPGAITTGLSYLKHKIGDVSEYGRIVEKIVIFTSPEIANRELTVKEAVINEYMSRNNRRIIRDKDPLTIIEEFLADEFEYSVEIYCCEVNVNNFMMCFETVAKALLKFHPPGDVGKHIWVNITGGTNILNAALMQVVYLSGLIPVLYYTFVANRDDMKYLNPFSESTAEFDFRLIYTFKTTFDKRFQYVLEELRNVGDWISSSDLLSRLKRKVPSLFQDIDITSFRRDYLNIMIGVSRKGSRAEGQEDLNRLNRHGEKILEIIQSVLFQALTREAKDVYAINELTANLKIKRLE